MNSLDFIIVGLGNPGKEYERTRHNAGFLAIDFLAKNFSCNINNEKFKGLSGMCQVSGKKVMLLKPQTYMNLSGQSVVSAMNFYKVKPENVILIFDDIYLPVGKLRIRKKGSHGGQNGVKNIMLLSGSDNFPRIKIGIGNKPNDSWELSDWVISKFSVNEIKSLEKTFENTLSAVELVINGKFEEAMSLYN